MDHDVSEGGQPEDTESLWEATTPGTDYSSLTDDLSVDVAVVGAGITGLTAAIRLAEAGRSVVVLEADRIVKGTTGKTTAKITSQHGLIYDYLRHTFGREKAYQYAQANETAIEEIAERVETEDIDCDFERTAAYTYTTSDDEVSEIEDEVEAASSLGLPASFTETTDLPFEVAGAVCFDDQAQFHPRKYLLAIAEAIEADGNHIFEETLVTDVDPGSPCRVSTTEGEVLADDVVVASHFPVFDRAGYFARLHPQRAYLLAVRVAGPVPEGMYITADDPTVTIRSFRTDDDIVLVGGQTHTAGSGPTPAERYERSKAVAREHFTVESVEYRWSTHDHWSVDRVPFVGPIGPRAEGVYVGTGFGGWGMTGGTAAGMIVADLITEGSNPWADVFDPMRLTPMASAGGLVEHLTAVTDRFVGSRVRALAEDEVPEPGEATVTSQFGRPIGVYRDESGDLHAVSAVCQHMGCVVDWNDAEQTWECACHGSRYDYDGTVLRGPALTDLPPQDF